MAVKFAPVRLAQPAATGDQDFTADLGGTTPNAVLFLVTEGSLDGTPADGAAICLGAATGATQRWHFGGASRHALATTDTRRWANNTSCIRVKDGAGNLKCEADFVKFLSTADTGDGTTGARINWSSADAVGRLVTCLLIVCDNARAGDAQLGNVDVATDVTAPGFRPSDVLVGNINTGFGPGAGEWYWSLGIAHDAGAVVDQRGFSFRSRDNRATGSPQAELYGSRAGGVLDTLGIEISAFDAQGFSATPRLASANFPICYLALDFGTRASWVGGVDSPTATGNRAETAPGFKPQLVLEFATMLQSLDTRIVTGDAGAFALSLFTDAAEFCNAAAEEDAAATTNNQALSDDQAINLDDHTGATAFDATFVSFDANGWTLNFSAADATLRKWFAFAVEAEAGGAATKTVASALEAAVQEQLALTASLNAGIARRATPAAFADAALARLVAMTAELEAGIQTVRTAQAGLQAAVQGAAEKPAVLDGVLQAAQTLTGAIEAAVSRAFVMAASLDANLTGEGIKVLAASLDAAVRKLVPVAAGLDAAVREARATLAGVDAAVALESGLAAVLDGVAKRAALLAGVGLEAALRGTTDFSAALDAVIGAVVLPGRTRTFVVPARGGHSVHGDVRTLVVPAGNRRH
ncbi:MAG: hypothetical protein ACE5GS_06695 [Kiloniellaceae bacterium]